MKDEPATLLVAALGGSALSRLSRGVLLLCSLSFILVILLAAQCLAAEWASLRAASFQLFSHTTAAEARHTAQQLETFRAALGHILGDENATPPTSPTIVLIFQDEAEFAPFNPRNGAGYFLKDWDANHIALYTGPREKTLRTAYHEYAHLLLGQRFQKLPLWLDEGLAEYYSSLRVDEGKIYVGGPLPGHLHTLRATNWLPLAKVLAADHQSPYYRDAAQRRIFYAQAWFLVHCLNTQPQQFAEFLALLDNGASALEALRQAFQMSPEDLETSYRAAFAAQTLPARAFPLPATFSANVEGLAAPVSEAEALAYQADLLRRLEHFADAETKLNQALALDAQQPHALAVAGLLRTRERRFDAARKLLAQACQAAPDNYLYHFYFAYAVSRAALDENNRLLGYHPDDTDAMRQALQRAIKLAPEFAEPYNLYAFINFVQRENLDEAEAMARQALTLAPRRLEWRLTLARILLRQNKFDLARETLGPVLATPLQEQARQILAEAGRAEAELAQREERKKRGVEDWEPTDGTTEVDFEKVSMLLQDRALRRALRPVGAGEARIQGLLTELACEPSGMVYLLVRAETRVYKLRAALPQVTFRAFAPGLSGAGRHITCGPRAPANPAVVTFRPTRDAQAKCDGEAVAVEFVPDKFKLEP